LNVERGPKAVLFQSEHQRGEGPLTALNRWLGVEVAHPVADPNPASLLLELQGDVMSLAVGIAGRSEGEDVMSRGFGLEPFRRHRWRQTPHDRKATCLLG
jgi:hypothetical protein